MAILTVIVVGLLYGAWLNAEKIAAGSEVEVHANSLRHLLVYCGAITLFAIIQAAIILQYVIISQNRNRRSMITTAFGIMFLLIFFEIIIILQI